MRFKLS